MTKTSKAVPRRRWRRWVLLLLLLATPFVILSYVGRKPTIEPGSVLVVRLAGEIKEGPSRSPTVLIEGLLGGDEVQPSLYDLRRALIHARRDPRIASVLLDIQPLQVGWAVVDEVRGLIDEVRRDKKPVHAFLASDFAEEKEYALAAAADRIVAVPEAGLLLNGLLAEVSFYRGLLDLLKIEPQMLQFKEYKSAGEPFVNRGMSQAMREALTAILSEIHGGFLKHVGERRHIEPAVLRELLDGGLLTTDEGIKGRLLDAVGHRDEVEAGLLGESQDDKKRSRKVVPLGRYMKALPDAPRMGQIALIYAVGPIVATSPGSPFGQDEVIEGQKTARAIQEAAETDHVKAIVMRVNSPGGSAVGSDFVWREIQRARTKKPVVVSMSTVAGSGGYWISMGADAIVAQPSTITGSIGVIALHFNVLPFMNWAGVNIDTIKLGENADLLSPFNPWSEAHAARMTAWMQKVYDDFVGRVAKGRNLSPGDVEPIARGRIWSGSEARKRRLVDELGGLSVALRIARERAKLPEEAEREPVVFPRPKGVLAALAQMTETREAIDPAATLRALIEEARSGPVLLLPAIDIR